LDLLSSLFLYRFELREGACGMPTPLLKPPATTPHVSHALLDISIAERPATANVV
jgi:hypothetical protein